MSTANYFSQVMRDSASSAKISSRVVLGATTLYTAPSYYVNNVLQWQFRAVPNPVPAQAPNHLNLLLDSGVFPDRTPF